VLEGDVGDGDVEHLHERGGRHHRRHQDRHLRRGGPGSGDGGGVTHWVRLWVLAPEELELTAAPFAGTGPLSLLPPAPRCTRGSTEMPGARRASTSAGTSTRVIFTGTRCTTFT